MTFRKRWRRVNRERPCPICERPDWCLLSDDGRAAICARVESPKRCGEAGWLHRLRADDCRPAQRFVRSVPIPSAAGRPDLAALANTYRASLDAEQLHALAFDLGLSVESVNALGIGWSHSHRAWSFPMTDPAGTVLGIRLRRPNGFKFAVAGGREGLFIPQHPASPKSLLLVAEGPTDTAALLDMGFSAVVGRPSCAGGVKLLVDLSQKWRAQEVVIVADGDEAGRRGAENLALMLLPYAKAVRTITPPAGIKDVRDWLNHGGSGRDVESAISTSPVRRMCMQVRRVTRGR